MPTERFVNLQEDKKNKIIRAAIDEFAACSYENASINQIIKRAGISRGSFYTYFKDKEELYQYLLRDTFRSWTNYIYGLLETSGKDIYDVMKLVVSDMIERNENEPEQCLTPKKLPNLGLLDKNSIAACGSAFKEQFFREFVVKCYRKTACFRKNGMVEWKFAYMMDILFTVVLKSVLIYKLGFVSKEEFLRMTDSQIELLRGTSLQ